jgi:DNA repair exonuclease SbcCD ATPase subunit
MKVKNLKITDLRNIEIFEGELADWNVITWKNGSGKSTVIDAIFWAIKGKTYFDSDPFRLIKKEKDQAVINLTLEGQNREIIINRSFTKPTEANPKGYDTLRIVDTSGAKITQKELNTFFSSFTIDPLHIARQKPKDQIDIIKEVAGIDTTEIEEKARETYDKRTIENRELTRLKWVVSEYEGVEEVKEVSVSDLIAERDKKQAENKEIGDLETDISVKKENITKAESEIEELKKKIENLEEGKKANTKILWELEEKLKNSKKHDLTEITEKINKSEEINEKARKYKEKLENIKKFDKQKEVCDALDKKYKDQLQAREDLIKNSNLPDYIDFDKNAGVLVNNIPFSQLNTAEQIKVAIQLGAILTPELKVLHIKDGSLLDEDTLKVVKEVVEAHDYQILIERVGEEDLGTITMREGVKI